MSDPGSAESKGSASIAVAAVPWLAGFGVSFAAVFALVSADEALSVSFANRWQAFAHLLLIFAMMIGLLRIRGVRPGSSFVTAIGLAVSAALSAALLEVAVLDVVTRVSALAGTTAVIATLLWPPTEASSSRSGLRLWRWRREVANGFDEQVSGTLKALHAASVIRDGDIREHGQAVANLAARLGATLGMPPAEVKALYWAALLHDVGKVGVERSVLRKPGKLTQDEFSRVKHHASIGADLIRSVGPDRLYRMIALMVLHHHERWDGRGYPSGRASTEIPVGSRIIAITDVFEALLSERAYRPAMRQEEAVKTIIEGSGTHFDPDIVSVFLKMLSGQSRVHLTVDAAFAATQRGDVATADLNHVALCTDRTTLAGFG